MSVARKSLSAHDFTLKSSAQMARPDFMVVVGGGCSCILLLHPVPTSADAGPEICNLCPDLCTLHPDLWALCLWCFPSFNWCKHSTCTGGNLRWWCFSIQPLAQIVHLHTWWYHLLQLALVVHFIQPLAQILYLHPGNLHCVVVVVCSCTVCGGGGIYV